MIELAPQQVEAAARVRQWLADPFGAHSREPGVFRLFGYAGTGKTSVAQILAADVAGQVRYAAFTGKAALVMHRKGCYGASTIHRLIYLPRIKCTQHLRQLAEQLRAETDEDRRRELLALHDAEKANLARPSFTLNLESPLRDAALLVLDEVSMIGEIHGRDLLQFRVPILALGDPAQLPPVKDRGYFTDPRQEPDFLLTDIHRQEQGSPVLKLATMARQGQEIPLGDYGQGTRVVAKKDVSIEQAMTFDQIIVGRNVTRRALNTRIRKVLGFETPVPQPGDRLVCLRNDGETGLMNGGQWRCLGAELLDEERVLLSIIDDENQLGLQVEAHMAYFRGEEPPFYEIRQAQCFDFAYAITCHKSQGDQFSSVCVVDESDIFGADRHRWLYTAITRASSPNLTIVK